MAVGLSDRNCIPLYVACAQLLLNFTSCFLPFSKSVRRSGIYRKCLGELAPQGKQTNHALSGKLTSRAILSASNSIVIDRHITVVISFDQEKVHDVVFSMFPFLMLPQTSTKYLQIWEGNEVTPFRLPPYKQNKIRDQKKKKKKKATQASKTAINFKTVFFFCKGFEVQHHSLCHASVVEDFLIIVIMRTCKRKSSQKLRYALCSNTLHSDRERTKNDTHTDNH